MCVSDSTKKDSVHLINLAPEVAISDCNPINSNVCTPALIFYVVQLCKHPSHFLLWIHCRFQISLLPNVISLNLSWVNSKLVLSSCTVLL